MLAIVVSIASVLITAGKKPEASLLGLGPARPSRASNVWTSWMICICRKNTASEMDDLDSLFAGELASIDKVFKEFEVKDKKTEQRILTEEEELKRVQPEHEVRGLGGSPELCAVSLVRPYTHWKSVQAVWHCIAIRTGQPGLAACTG